MERQPLGGFCAHRLNRATGDWSRWRRHAALMLGMAALAVLSAISSAHGAQYFVAPIGDNGAAGTAAQPWASLQHAADVVGPGDRVVVRPGNYAGFYHVTDGTSDSPIEFFAEPGALIDEENGTTADGINLEGASYVVIDGFAVTGMGRAGVRSVLADHVTIRNVHAYDNDRWGIFTGFVDDLVIENNETSGSKNEHGIYVSNSGDRPVLRNNYSWGNHASGIHMNGDESQGGDGLISNALISGNRIFNNAVSINGSGLGGGSGINMDGVQDSLIENNLVYGNHASGISLYKINGAEGSNGNVVINNTIHQPNDGRWAINIRDGSINNTIQNNILLSEHSFRGGLSVWEDSLPGLASDYNVMISRITTDDSSSVQTLAQWQATTAAAGTPQDVHSLEAVGGAAALFVDPAAGDYRLKPGALAIDMGTALGAPSVDLLGTARPQGAGFDAGAIELPAELTADFNSDSRVDALDMAAWQGGFGTTTSATLADGDADGDEDVDGHDFLAWQQQLGTGLPGAASVPEPACCWLMLAAALLLRRR